MGVLSPLANGQRELAGAPTPARRTSQLTLAVRLNRLAHVAVLVLLAAAARAGVVAADLLAAVADRLEFLVAGAVVRDRLVVAVGGAGLGRRLVDGRADDPQRLLEGL